MRPALQALAALVVAGSVLSGCSDEDTPRADTSPSSSTSTPPTSSAPPTPSTTPTESTSTAAPAGPDWKPVPGSTKDAVTISGRWTLTMPEDGHEVTLDGPRPHTFTPPDGFTFSDALIDGQFAVVSAEDHLAQKPNVATVLDLRSGRTTTIDGDSEVPTTVGGVWALGSGLLVHATTQGSKYCLATVDLLSGHQSSGPCVPPRNGITNVVVTPAGTSAMTFNAGHPSCRTVNTVEGSTFRPIPGPPDCKAWDALATETGTIWSVVTNEHRVEEAHFYADFGNGQQDLGPGTSGTLTWCGSAAYFVRDPQSRTDPAQLIRVTESGSEVAYSSQGTGNAFLAEPRCGGRDLTVTSLTTAGDEQVTTRVG